MTRRVSSPELIDRSSELAALDEAWRDVAAGRPRVVLVRADPGLGKTRLLSAFEAEYLADAVVLRGSCVHAAGVASPLLPFVTVVSELVGVWGSERVGELTRGSAPLLESLLQPRGAVADVPLETAYDVLARVLDAASREQPLAVLLEDLHWAAPETWALLDHVARAMRSSRLLVVATLRSELGMSRALGDVVHELMSLPHVETLDLPPLSPSGVRQQLRGILDRSPTEDLAERTVVRSQGVPFLVEELAAAAAAGDTGVPRSLRDVLLHRTLGLSDKAQAALDAGAVSVRPLDLVTLREVSGLAAHAVRDALSELREAGILVFDSADGVADFRHALLREAVEAQLPAGDRAMLHRRHAELLDRAGSEDPRAVLAAAHHWAHADAPDQAWRATAVAVDTAAARGYHREEWRLLSQQLDRYDTAVALGIPDLPERLSLVRRTAVAACRCGEYDEGGRLLDLEWRSMDLVVDAEQAVQILGDICTWVHGGAAAAPDVEAAVRTCLAALPAGPTRPRERGLIALLSFQTVRREFEAASRTLDEAVACAEALGDEVKVAELRLSAVFMLGEHHDDPVAALGQFARTRSICAAHGDRDLVLWSLMNESDYLFLLGRYGDAEQRAREALMLAEQLPARADLYEFVIGNLFEALLATGRWAEARDRMVAHLEIDRAGYMRGVSYLLVAGLWLELGDLAGASESLAEGRVRVPSVADPQFPVAEASVAAELALANTAPADAVQSARDAFLAHAHHVPTSRSCLLLHTAARAAAHLPAPDPALTGWMAAGVEKLRGREPVPAWWAPLLAAEVAETNVPLWDAATAAMREHEVPVLVALQATVGACSAALAAGHRDQASTRLAEVLREADQLGAQRVRGEAEQLAAHYRLPIDADQGVATRSGIPHPRNGLAALTPREVEVLRLIAAGHSNGRIAAELTISVKTASVHVSHILDKLGVTSRGEAAALAWQAGLPVAVGT
jgi:DNA-binding CsgD family transcriptional regulator